LTQSQGQRTEEPLVLRPLSGRPIDRRDAYRMVVSTAKVAGIPRDSSSHSLRHAVITSAPDAGIEPHPRAGRQPKIERSAERLDRVWPDTDPAKRL